MYKCVCVFKPNVCLYVGLLCYIIIKYIYNYTTVLNESTYVENLGGERRERDFKIKFNIVEQTIWLVLVVCVV